MRVCVAHLLLAALYLGCADPLPTIDVELQTAPNDDPFSLADYVQFEALSGTQVLLSRSFSLSSPRGSFGPLPENQRLVLAVSLYRGEPGARGSFVVGRGRSYPFSYRPGVTSDVSVFLGSTGRFVLPVEDEAIQDPRFVGATSYGALIAQGNGVLRAYRVAHQSGGPRLETLVNEPKLASAYFSRFGGCFIAVNDDHRLVIFDEEGQVRADPDIDVSELGSVVTPVPGLDGERLWLMGGPALTRIEKVARLETAGLRTPDCTQADTNIEVSLSAPVSLPLLRIGASYHTLDAAQGAERLLVFGGADSGVPQNDVLLIDPASGRVDATLPVYGDTATAAITELATGQVLVAGGLDTLGQPSRETAVVLVGPDALQSFRIAQDAAQVGPAPLKTARSGGIAITYDEQLAIIAGGESETPTPAEVFDFGSDALPGVTAATDALPRMFTRPVGARLDDGTVLLADALGVTVYIPERIRPR